MSISRTIFLLLFFYQLFTSCERKESIVNYKIGLDNNQLITKDTFIDNRYTNRLVLNTERVKIDGYIMQKDNEISLYDFSLKKDIQLFDKNIKTGDTIFLEYKELAGLICLDKIYRKDRIDYYFKIKYKVSTEPFNDYLIINSKSGVNGFFTTLKNYGHSEHEDLIIFLGYGQISNLLFDLNNNESLR